MSTREDIIALMQDEEFSGLSELRRLGAEAVPFLQELAKAADAPAYLRQRAAIALGEIGALEAAATLEALLTDTSPVLRLMAAQALEKVRGPASQATLLPLLTDPDPSVRKVVVGILAEIGDSNTLPALAALRETHQQDFLGDVITAAIDRITERSG